jgi:hypothetical protein
MICHVSPNFTSSILGCKGKSFILIANDPFKFFVKIAPCIILNWGANCWKNFLVKKHQLVEWMKFI